MYVKMVGEGGKVDGGVASQPYHPGGENQAGAPRTGSN